MAPSVSSSADLTARDFIPVQGAVSTNKLTPITIVGIVIAALLGVGAALWVAIRWYRKRQTRNRGDKRASAFLNVRGVSKEGEEPKEVQGPRCVVHSFTRFVRSYFLFKFGVLRNGVASCVWMFPAVVLYGCLLFWGVSALLEYLSLVVRALTS